MQKKDFYGETEQQEEDEQWQNEMDAEADRIFDELVESELLNIEEE